MTVFSFHPVKHITTGEGGMVTTDSTVLAERMRSFRNHGISLDHSRRAENNTWIYEIDRLGYNYRLSDIQCSLGLSQLKKLDLWLDRRQEIAERYNTAFKGFDCVRPLEVKENRQHAYHLYVIELLLEKISLDRGLIFRMLREMNIGVNVHYIPVHLHPLYRQRFGYGSGLCPHAESMYERILTLPLHQGMSDGDVDRVIECVGKVTGKTGV